MSPQKKATIISATVAFCLAILKLGVGIFSGSIAVLSSAIDSLLDMGVSLFNIFAISGSEQDPNKKYNFGKGKLEALAAFLEGLIISLSGGYIFYESIKKIISPTQITHINTAIVVMVISVICTSLLVTFLTKTAKKTNNLVIKADALHYKTDVFTNITILVSIIIIHFTDWFIIDGVLGIIIALYILKEAYKIIKEGYQILLDTALEENEVNNIKRIICGHKDIQDFHEFRTRISGNIKYVQGHLVFGKNMSLYKAHEISHEVEDAIKSLDTTSKWNILFHLDPYDDSIRDTQ